MARSPAHHRPDGRHEQITRQVRQQIVAGLWQPGQRLPTRLLLEQQFGASSRTVQQALSALLRDGFVRADRRHGTFVVDAPPHLARYGLVLPVSPTEREQFGHWRALHAAAAVLAGNGHRCETYYLANSYGDTPELRRLASDVVEQRVAGLLFGWPPFGLQESPILTTPGVPRLAVGALNFFPGVTNVAYDIPSYAAQVVANVRTHGRRRLALLVAQYAEHSRADLQRCLTEAGAAAGVTVPPQWVLGVARHLPDLTRNCLHLLLNRPPADRPDAILIQDDNLVADVTAALAELHVRVPEDLLVVAHTNFPCPAPTATPVCQVGFDMRAVWHAARAAIDAGRRGEPLPPTVVIPAHTGGE